MFVRYVFTSILALLLSGCGYAPVAHYAQRALGDSIYVDLKINLANTENSVEMRDLLYRTVVTRFQKEIKGKEEADSIINAVITSITDSSIATNSSGFTTFYRASVTINFKITNKATRGERTFTNSAYYDYAVSFTDPTITYNNRLEAISEATSQCVDRLIAQVAYSGKK